jgi:hypothetical protein
MHPITAMDRKVDDQWIRRRRFVRPQAKVFIEQGMPRERCLTRGSVTAGGDRHTFVGVYDSRQEAVADVTGWALGWVRRLREFERRARSPS